MYSAVMVLLCAYSPLMLAQPVSESANGKGFELSGWIDAQYRYEQGAAIDNSNFMIRRSRLSIKGILAPKLDYRIQVDFAPNTRLIDAYFRIKALPFAGLQIGQFKIPFSLENRLSPLTLELIDNANVVSALSGYKDVTGISSYSNGRDIGIMLTGTIASAEIQDEKVSILSYNIGLFGGNGINVKTDNKAKDLAIQVDFCPFVKGLLLSASAYLGRYDMLWQGTATGIDGDRNRYAFGMQYDNGSLTLRTEYLWGKTDFALLDTVFNSTATESRGAYLTAGHWINVGKHNQRMRPLARLEYYESNVADDDPLLGFSAGMEWLPNRSLRLQLAYTLASRGSNNKPHNCLTALATARF